MSTTQDLSLSEYDWGYEEDSPQIVVDCGPRNPRGTRLVRLEVGGREHRDTLNTDSEAQRQKLVRHAAEKFGVPADSLAYLDDLLVRHADDADAAAEQAALARREEPTPTPAVGEPPPEIREAAEQFLRNPNLMEELSRDAEALGIVGETSLVQMLYIIGTSRKLDKPLGGVIQAASSSGKSYVTAGVVGLMPPEDVICATTISPQALYYMQQGALVNKLVCVAERKHAHTKDDPDEANATLALRELLSSGKLKKLVTIRTDDGPRTQVIEQDGPIAYLETTTQEQIFAEDATRLLSLTVDESRAQTERIIASLAEESAGRSTSGSEARSAVQQKHQFAQRLLRSLRVRIPYARHLCIPAERVASRRAFSQLLGCIEAIALLHQFHRNEEEEDTIVATLDGLPMREEPHRRPQPPSGSADEKLSDRGLPRRPRWEKPDPAERDLIPVNHQRPRRNRLHQMEASAPHRADRFARQPGYFAFQLRLVHGKFLSSIGRTDCGSTESKGEKSERRWPPSWVGPSE